MSHGTPEFVHQFLIILRATDPLGWRCIQVPLSYSDPEHSERESLLAWAGGSYDPDAFDPSTVGFDDSLKRWKGAFER